MLVKVLHGFDGTMLFVSHDRTFLSALSNRAFELTPRGRTCTEAGTPNTGPRPAGKLPG
jgi:ATPase subunit of ABC transporter with duplicated ATPase domains